MTKQSFKQKESELDWEQREELERKRKQNKGKQIGLDKIVKEKK